MADTEKKKAAAAEAKTAAPKKATKPLPKSAGKASPKTASPKKAAKKAEAKAKTPVAKADKPKGKSAKAVKGDTLTVVQTGSSTRRPADQHATLVGLGLGRIGKRRLLADTASVRGMIDKVAHLVRVEDAAPSAGEK